MLLLVSTTLLVTSSSQAQQGIQIRAADGSANDEFGGWSTPSLAISSNVVAAGAWQDASNGDGSGSVYVFQSDGPAWTDEVKLIGAMAGDAFGYCVSVSGNVLVVGAPGDSGAGENAGAIFVFRFDGVSWQEEQKLVASDAFANNELGRSCDLTADGNLLIGTGILGWYVFRFDGSVWQEEQILSPGLTNWGSSSSIDDRIAVVGVQQDDAGVSDGGAAYIFRFDGMSWVQEDKLIGSMNARARQLGISASIQGSAVVLGGLDVVYVFRFDGISWHEEQRIPWPGPSQTGGFGNSVSLHDDKLIVGAPEDELVQFSGDGAGAAFVYEFDGSSWQFSEKLVEPTRRMWGKFGGQVAITDSWRIASSPSWSGSDLQGYVYAFSSSSVGVDDPSFVPYGIIVAQNYPNPFHTTTEIAFSLPLSEEVRINVYDILGHEVARLIDGVMPSGSHSVKWDASGVPAGVYVYKMETGGASQSGVAVVAK